VVELLLNRARFFLPDLQVFRFQAGFHPWSVLVSGIGVRKLISTDDVLGFLFAQVRWILGAQTRVLAYDLKPETLVQDSLDHRPEHI
jgi:hypothetical protein